VGLDTVAGGGGEADPGVALHVATGEFVDAGSMLPRHLQNLLGPEVGSGPHTASAVGIGFGSKES